MGDDLVVVTVPLISPNEPESLLADLPIQRGRAGGKRAGAGDFRDDQVYL